jgi:hypothetical protein
MNFSIRTRGGDAERTRAGQTAGMVRNDVLCALKNS